MLFFHFLLILAKFGLTCRLHWALWLGTVFTVLTPSWCPGAAQRPKSHGFTQAPTLAARVSPLPLVDLADLLARGGLFEIIIWPGFSRSALLKRFATQLFFPGMIVCVSCEAAGPLEATCRASVDTLVPPLVCTIATSADVRSLWLRRIVSKIGNCHFLVG